MGREAKVGDFAHILPIYKDVTRGQILVMVLLPIVGERSVRIVLVRGGIWQIEAANDKTAAPPLSLAGGHKSGLARVEERHQTFSPSLSLSLSLSFSPN